MCLNIDFEFSEEESSCNEGEEVHAYQCPRVIDTEEVVSIEQPGSLLNL